MPARGTVKRGVAEAEHAGIGELVLGFACCIGLANARDDTEDGVLALEKALYRLLLVGAVAVPAVGTFIISEVLRQPTTQASDVAQFAALTMVVSLPIMAITGAIYLAQVALRRDAQASL